jgi:hypothetical protein
MDYKDSQYRRPDPDDRLTLRRVANGLCFVASLILLFVFLAPIF